MTISASVGQGGRNLAEDVRRVQSLLNDNGATPRLVVDGACGGQTIRAIRWFQERIVRMRSPDGRIDPGGTSWRALSQRDGRNPREAAPRRDAPSVDERREFRDERRQYVDPRVQETAATTRIIDALLPHMRGTDLKIISGWLSDADQFWKVNYHWELLLWMAERSLGLPIDDKAKRELQAIRSALLSNPPNPRTGYRTSASTGKPVDSSDAKTIIDRHAMLSQQKRVFKQVMAGASLIAKSRDPAQAFHLAAAPVAPPGTSKHGTGYALDIQGSAGTVKSICNKLGASLVFDEKSHTHVEFKHGVK